MYNKVELCGVNTAELPILSEQEKRDLLTRARAGDKAARQSMIEGNLRLVLSVVQRFSQRGENMDDLFQVGCIGLIGLVMLEKKIARREYFCSLSLISSNFSSASSSWENACTTFWLPTISSINAVCSPLVSDCSLNMENVFFAMKLATNRETGVMTTTATVIRTLIVSMKISVPKMVTIPVKNWVNPIRSPSAN